MPSGLLDALKESQVRDLLTFLLYEPPQREQFEQKLPNAIKDVKK